MENPHPNLFSPIFLMAKISDPKLSEEDVVMSIQPLSTENSDEESKSTEEEGEGEGADYAAPGATDYYYEEGEYYDESDTGGDNYDEYGNDYSEGDKVNEVIKGGAEKTHNIGFSTRVKRQENLANFLTRVKKQKNSISFLLTRVKRQDKLLKHS